MAAIALILALLPLAGVQGPVPWIERPAEALELVRRPDLPDAVRSGEVPEEALWELLEAFVPSCDSDEVAGEIVQYAARALFRVGEARLRRNEREVARVMFERAQRVLPERHQLRYYFLHQLAALAGNDPDLALGYLAEARASLPDDAADDLAASLDLVRAGLYFDLGVVDRAEPLITGALRRAQLIRAEGNAGKNFLGLLLTAYSQRARLQLAMSRPDRLIEDAREALRDMDELHAAYGAAGGRDRQQKIEVERPKLRTLLGMALAAKSVALPELAAEARSELLGALADPAVEPLKQLDCELTLGQLAVFGEDVPEAERWIGAARERRLDPRARGFVDALDARLAVVRGDDTQRLEAHRERLAEDLAAMVEQCLESDPRPGGQAFLRYGRRRFVVSELMSLTMALTPGEAGELAALEVLHGLGETDTLVRRMGAAPAPLAVVRSALTGDAGGALVYFMGIDRSHVFALDGGAVVHRTLPGAWDLGDAVREFQRERLRRQGSSAAERLASMLLPAAVGERLDGWAAVTVVGADLIDDPAFESLPYEGRSLGEAKAVAYLSTLALGHALLEGGESPIEGGRPTALCLVGDVAPRGDQEELPLAGAVADDLTGPFGDSVALLLGESATLAGLRAERLDEVRLLHFVTHGLVDVERERSSGLLLSPDSEQPSGAIWSEEVETLPAPPLVVLSACGTARGPIRPGSGLAAHLGGAFLFAGARAVVLSDSDLRYEPTMTFMVAFHEALASGSTVAEAARRGREELVRARPGDGRDHASRIRVIGLGHEPVFEPRAAGGATGPPWVWLLAGGGLLLAGVLARQLVRRASSAPAS